jgi:excisionase family DNA binding protein
MREKLMTIDQLAEMLSMTRKTIYQNVYYRRIPALQINRKTLRFCPKAIAAWLESKSRPIVEKEPKMPVRRKSSGRPRKDGTDDYINRLVNQAKEEVLV